MALTGKPLGKSAQSARYRIVGLAVLIHLSLAIASPLWHTKLHVSAQPFHPAGVERGHTIHDSGMPSLLSEPCGHCPICLTQRLLMQSQTEETAELLVVSSDFDLAAWQPTITTITVSQSERPRAPPLC